MIRPAAGWVYAEGWVVDLRTSMMEVLQHNGLQTGSVDPGAVVIDGMQKAYMRQPKRLRQDFPGL